MTESVNPMSGAAAAKLVLVLAAPAVGAGLVPALGSGLSTAPNASRSAPLDARDVRCVERPEGCVYCEGRGPTSPLVDPDALPASLCDPKDPGTCVDFCTSLAPECAVPWRAGPSCLLPSELEFRRDLFRRETADRAEALVQGRVSDEEQATASRAPRSASGSRARRSSTTPRAKGRRLPPQAPRGPVELHDPR